MASTGVQKSIYLPADLAERVERYAAEQDRSVSWVVARAIEKYLAPTTARNPEGASKR